MDMPPGTFIANSNGDAIFEPKKLEAEALEAWEVAARAPA
jgi:hypothetical protein